ncbi:MAG: hypothetical protein QOK29_571 [Rhodospirillaceae bacterium]|jgi:hypothetical protein|nr:hypothetical protein [Rhodospirillaceae bacterium]
MQTYETVTGAPDLPMGWRFKVGITLFTLMILLWLLIPIEAALGMSAGTIAATTAGIAIANKIILLLAIAVMGKPGFRELKGRAFGHVKHLAPVATVSPTRYRIGLVMFCLPFLQGLLETWASHIAPQLVANRLWVDVLMDVMLIASLFVLGGNFWDKLRALFFVDARAVFPTHSNTTAAAPPVK